MRRLIATTSKPAAINALTCVCRRAWNITCGKPELLHARPQSRLRLSGDIGEPSGLQNTRASGSGLPSPRANRISSCLRRCSRSTATAFGGNEIVRRPRLVLGGLNLSPALVFFKLARRSRRHGPSKSQVAPPYRKQFAAAHPRCQGNGGNRIEIMALKFA